MRIAFCASEMVPFAKTGGLADVAGALPLALEAAGHEVIVIMPGYKAIQGLRTKVQGSKNDISFAALGKNIKVYFIECDKYFGRDGLYGDKIGDYPDNLERFSFYCRRALELLKELNFRADIVHAHDWQAGLIPVYLKAAFTGDAFFKSIRSVLTIHNIGYQGLFEKQEFPKLGLDWEYFNIEGLEFYDRINILKGGIEFCDIITTVSPTYAKEVQTKEFGFGLEGLLSKRRRKLFGILNGLDYSLWDPGHDKALARNYSTQRPEDKQRNKEYLQKLCGLAVAADAPLFGMVTRLVDHKGLDILTPAIKNISAMGAQMVILGTGEAKYHSALERIAKKNPASVSLHLKFDDELARRIYAGADLFLMPSRYEPCGLGQMIALRYGAIPLVFSTGGLADTVNAENGFVFDKYNKEELLRTVKKALEAFRLKGHWLRLMHRAMRCDFSWEEAAGKYIKLYEKAKLG